MAKVRYNRAIKDIRGKIDRFVYRRMLGRDVVSGEPGKQERKRAGAEAKNNDRFAEATEWAKRIPADRIPRYDAVAKRDNISKFSARTRDFLRPPKIVAVFADLPAGLPIFVIARDDFEVKEVRVTLRQPDGQLVESGTAVRCGHDLFRYVPSPTVPRSADLQIEVVARDWPDHVAKWISPPPASVAADGAVAAAGASPSGPGSERL
jgi:hypothetical protein